MHKTINFCNIYIALWCVYYLQGFLYDRDSGISKYLVVIILLLSLWIAFKAVKNYSLPRYFKGVIPLLLMFFVYWCFLLINDHQYVIKFNGMPVDKLSFFKTILITWLPIYAGYYFTARGFLTEKVVKIWIVIFFVVATLLYFQNQRDMLENAMSMGSSREDFTNNDSYMFLALLPSLVLFRDKILIQYTSIIYCIVFLFFSVKRGAILIGIIVLLMFLWESFRYSSKRKKALIIFFSAMVIAFASYFFMYMLANNEYFNDRFLATMGGYMSSRDVIAGDIMKYLRNDATVSDLLFGSGVYSTLDITINFAHNDWLELMCCEGLLGVCVYIYYWVNFYKYSCSVDRRYPEYLAIRMILVIYLFKTFFSMSYSDMPFFVTIPFGFFLYMSNKSPVLKTGLQN